MARRMMSNKRGNVMLIIFPIGVTILIVILIAVIFLYIQIAVQIYDVKSNIFYLVQSSIDKEGFEKMAYRDYMLNSENIKKNLNDLLAQNYLNVDNRRVGIIDIKCNKISIFDAKEKVISHTKNTYNVPIICVNIEIKFTPIISFLGKEIKFNIHDDIKLSLLEF